MWGDETSPIAARFAQLAQDCAQAITYMLALLKCGNTVHNKDTHFHHGKIAFSLQLLNLPNK